MSTHFVPEELVLIMHADLLQRYGGRPGVRDRGLLASALAQPQMTMGGKALHRTLFDKAAAYGFHLCSNHPFVDGNKRIALVVMDIFLQKNGWEITGLRRGGLYDHDVSSVRKPRQTAACPLAESAYLSRQNLIDECQRHSSLNASLCYLVSPLVLSPSPFASLWFSFSRVKASLQSGLLF